MTLLDTTLEVWWFDNMLILLMIQLWRLFPQDFMRSFPEIQIMQSQFCSKSKVTQSILLFLEWLNVWFADIKMPYEAIDKIGLEV